MEEKKKKEVEHPRRHVPAFLYSVRLQVVLCFLAFKKRFGSGPEAAATAKKKGRESLLRSFNSPCSFLLTFFFSSNILLRCDIRQVLVGSTPWHRKKKTMQMP